jgi:hypothetical protein
VWSGHSCPLPLTLILTLTFVCHPEEAESHAKRATPDEGPMQLADILGYDCSGKGEPAPQVRRVIYRT